MYKLKLVMDLLITQVMNTHTHPVFAFYIRCYQSWRLLYRTICDDEYVNDKNMCYPTFQQTYQLAALPRHAFAGV